MTMLPVYNGDWVAEVIESSTTEFTAECRVLNGSPPFGAREVIAIGGVNLTASHGRQIRPIRQIS